MADKCQFLKAWIGKCGKETHGRDYCDEHLLEVCVSCGSPATRQCEETLGLVCGAPLCNKCEHTLLSKDRKLPEGLSGHCRKDEQVYDLWGNRRAGR